jgi:hypothetical protein
MMVDHDVYDVYLDIDYVLLDDDDDVDVVYLMYNQWPTLQLLL